MSAKKRKTRSAGKRKTITAVEAEPIREKLGLLESAGKEGRKGATRSVGKVKYPPHPVILAALWGTGVLISIITAATHLQAQVITILISVAFTVLNSIFVFRLWKLVQTSDLPIKKPSAGKAIGFSFIPFFGLYWIFIMYRNLALHLNHLTSHNKGSCRTGYFGGCVAS